MMLVFAWLVCLIASLPALVLATECLVGSLGRAERSAAGDAPAFTVLMPAHNEAHGIARSVGLVVAQLRAEDRLIVIADNCTDETASVAMGAGASVITRVDPERRGKGYALEFGRRFVADDGRAIVVIVDADCAPAAGALRQLVATAARYGSVVQGAYLLEPGPDVGPMVRVSCLAFLVKNLVRQRALMRLAGAALLQGSGMAFPYPLFRSAAWCPTSLIEDLELGVRLLASGKPVIFDARARFFSEASSSRGTISQRRRWEHGMLQSMFRFAPKLAWTAAQGRWRLLFLALDLLVPPTVLLLLAAAVITAAMLIIVGFSSPVLVLVAAQLALALGLWLAWWVHGRALLPASALGRVLGYMVWKLPVLAQFVTRRERRWLRTERGS